MLQPVKNLDEYKRIKDALRQRFDADRLGEQHLFTEQSKILQPLIKPLMATQAATVRAIEASAGQPAILGEPSPLRPSVGIATRDWRSNPERRALLATEEEAPPIKIDLDSGLDDIDVRNLQDLNFELPSAVFKDKQIEKTIAKIKTENRRIGQKLGKMSDATAEEKEVYKSWKKTLEIYRQKIQGLESAKQFVGKGARGPPSALRAHEGAAPDVIFYPNVDDLCTRLAELYAAKQAGNTGLDNVINSILDELLRTQAISKEEYNNLYKLIFVPII